MADKRDCDLCGEPLGDEAIAELYDTEKCRSLIVHAEPCSYDHGDGERYKLA